MDRDGGRLVCDPQGYHRDDEAQILGVNGLASTDGSSNISQQCQNNYV